MQDIITKEGLKMRINVPVITPGTKLALYIFFTGIGERGTDINKVDNVGPLYYVNNPDALVDTSFYIAVGPLNESDSWTVAEVWSALNYCLETFTDILDFGSIHAGGHSLGGQGIWAILTSQTVNATGKRLCDYFASVTPIAPVPGPLSKVEEIAATGIPGWAFHSEFDSNSGTPFKSTEALVNAINTAAGRPLWRLQKWPGTSHSIVAKTFKMAEYVPWVKVCRRSFGAQPVTDVEIINDNEVRFKTANSVYSTMVTKI